MQTNINKLILESYSKYTDEELHKIANKKLLNHHTLSLGLLGAVTGKYAGNKYGDYKNLASQTISDIRDTNNELKTIRNKIPKIIPISKNIDDRLNNLNDLANKIPKNINKIKNINKFSNRSGAILGLGLSAGHILKNHIQRKRAQKELKERELNRVK